MKEIGIALVVLLAASICHAEKLPANLSREPNCIKDTFCLKKDDVYIDNMTLPTGFSREPDCSADVKVICVSKSLYLEAKELIEITKATEAEIKDFPPASIKFNAVMNNIVLVSVYKQDYFGTNLLLEKQADRRWVVIRKEHNIY